MARLPFTLLIKVDHKCFIKFQFRSHTLSLSSYVKFLCKNSRLLFTLPHSRQCPTSSPKRTHQKNLCGLCHDIPCPTTKTRFTTSCTSTRLTFTSAAPYTAHHHAYTLLHQFSATVIPSKVSRIDKIRTFEVESSEVRKCFEGAPTGAGKFKGKRSRVGDIQEHSSRGLVSDGRKIWGW